MVINRVITTVDITIVAHALDSHLDHVLLHMHHVVHVVPVVLVDHASLAHHVDPPVQLVPLARPVQLVQLDLPVQLAQLVQLDQLDLLDRATHAILATHATLAVHVIPVDLITVTDAIKLNAVAANASAVYLYDAISPNVTLAPFRCLYG